MKTRVTFLVLLLLVVSFGFGLARQSQQSGNSCGFAVHGEPAQPMVSGPDDIAPLVYVVEQPDSPIEVVSEINNGRWYRSWRSTSSVEKGTRLGSASESTLSSR